MPKPPTRADARRTADRERGAVAAEFALVMPLLIILLFSIIEFGQAYNARITVSHAAREGARELAVSGDFTAATTAATQAASNLDPGSLTFGGGPSPCSAGETVNFQVSYPFDFEIPFIGSQTFNLDSTGVMRCGG